MVIIHESVKNGSVIRVKYKESISYRNPAKFARSIIGGNTGSPVIPGSSGVVLPLTDSGHTPVKLKNKGAAHGLIIGPGPPPFNLDNKDADETSLQEIGDNHALVTASDPAVRHRLTIKEGRIQRPLLNPGVMTDMPRTAVNSTSQSNITAIKRILRVLRQVTLQNPCSPSEGWPYGKGASVQQIFHGLVNQRHTDYSEVMISQVLRRAAAQGTVRLLPNGNYVLAGGLGSKRLITPKPKPKASYRSMVNNPFTMAKDHVEVKEPSGLSYKEEWKDATLKEESEEDQVVFDDKLDEMMSKHAVEESEAVLSSPIIPRNLPPPPALTPGASKSLLQSCSVSSTKNLTAPQLKKIDQQPRPLPGLTGSPVKHASVISGKSILTSASTELSAAGRYLAHSKRQATHILDKKKKREEKKLLRQQLQQQKQLEKEQLKEHRKRMKEMQYQKQQSEKRQSEQESVSRGRPVSKRKKFKKNLGPDFLEPSDLGMQYLKNVDFEPKCDQCSNPASKNTKGRHEELLVCKDCNFKAHPSCLQYSTDLAKKCRQAPWQCMYCKDCCKCDGSGDVESILFCDACDKGYHMDCHEPRIRVKPQGIWICTPCLRERSGKDTGRGGRKSNKNLDQALDDDEDDESSSVASEIIADSGNKKSKVKKVVVQTSRGTTKIVKKKGNWKGYALIEETDDDDDHHRRRKDLEEDHVPSRSKKKDDTTKIVSMLKPDLDTLTSVYPNMTINATSWSTEDVENFIQFIGFSDEAAMFREQEVDGLSLLLFKRSDILDGMSMKLGPAVKIYGHIQRLQSLIQSPNRVRPPPPPLIDMNGSVINGSRPSQGSDAVIIGDPNAVESQEKMTVSEHTVVPSEETSVENTKEKEWNVVYNTVFSWNEIPSMILSAWTKWNNVTLQNDVFTMMF